MDRTQLPDDACVLEPGEANFVAVNGRVYRGSIVGLWRRYAAIAGALDAVFAKTKGRVERITGVTIRCPSNEADSWLLVVRAVRKGDRIVAFHRGRSAADCVEDFAIRLKGEAVDWRDDKPQSVAMGGGENGRGELPPLELD